MYSRALLGHDPLSMTCPHCQNQVHENYLTTFKSSLIFAPLPLRSFIINIEHKTITLKAPIPCDSLKLAVKIK